MSSLLMHMQSVSIKNSPHNSRNKACILPDGTEGARAVTYRAGKVNSPREGGEKEEIVGSADWLAPFPVTSP